ncbi:hypothetical protein J1N35_002852 [Gossypium stocksii]|uniref:F-box associated domain-containing protein n=1 Tax=Gossypium stocksii TaxID=47602 RepID=A0A9D3WN39_9ROSI|nr:hypothetical protein J1N35_002852 [Gossypium stocksii]
MEIYSSQTRSWRRSGKPFLTHVNTGFEGGLFCNGAIHWLGAYNNTSFYFNVEDEELRDLPMPPIPDDWEDLRRVLYSGESRNHLHLIEIYRPPTSRFSVYEIESDYSGWFVKYNINLDPLIVAYPGMVRTYLDPSDLHYYAFSIFYIVREANDEESYMVLHIPEKAIRVLSTKWPRIELTRSDKHSPNAEAIANNYDLLMHIFACLPIKSLSLPIPNSLVAFFSTCQASSCRNRVLQSSNLNMASSLLETCHQPMMLPLYVS